MTKRRIAKVLVVVLLGVVLEFGYRRYHEEWRTKGKQAFLVMQSDRFDKAFVKPRWAVPGYLVGIGFSGLVFGIYEVTAWAVGRAMGSRRDGAA
jgi:hypothetical protein